jgi:hypothetical protein
MPTKKGDQFEDAVKPALGEEGMEGFVGRDWIETIKTQHIKLPKEKPEISQICCILESLLSDLQKTAEVLRRGQRKGGDDDGLVEEKSPHEYTAQLHLTTTGKMAKNTGQPR